MSVTDDTRKALERKADPPPTLLQLIERQTPAIERALPAAIGAERFARIVMTEVRRNPLLLECAPESVLGALMLTAQLGLEPGPLGHAYLVPYKKECTFILGYKGMIELASRSGRLRSIVARTVYEGDDFAYAYGIADRLHHVPAQPGDRGGVLLYYGLARFAAPAGHALHVMYPQEVDSFRLRSQLGKLDKGPWHTDYDAMARKTVIRRMAAYLPQSPLFARGLEADDHVSRFEDAEIVVEASDDE